MDLIVLERKVMDSMICMLLGKKEANRHLPEKYPDTNESSIFIADMALNLYLESGKSTHILNEVTELFQQLHDIKTEKDCQHSKYITEIKALKVKIEVCNIWNISYL